jgi:hypothetical protein
MYGNETSSNNTKIIEEFEQQLKSREDIWNNKVFDLNQTRKSKVFLGLAAVLFSTMIANEVTQTIPHAGFLLGMGTIALGCFAMAKITERSEQEVICLNCATFRKLNNQFKDFVNTVENALKTNDSNQTLQGKELIKKMADVQNKQHVKIQFCKKN